MHGGNNRQKTAKWCREHSDWPLTSHCVHTVGAAAAADTEARVHPITCTGKQRTGKDLPHFGQVVQADMSRHQCRPNADGTRPVAGARPDGMIQNIVTGTAADPCACGPVLQLSTPAVPMLVAGISAGH